MLTEASIDYDQVRSMVFGIGLNVNSSTNQFPKTFELLHLMGYPAQMMHELATNLIKISMHASQECLMERLTKLLKIGRNGLSQW